MPYGKRGVPGNLKKKQSDVNVPKPIEIQMIDLFEKRRKAMTWTAGIVLFIVIFFAKAPDRRYPLYELVEIIGYFLVTLAILGRTWCILYLAGHKNTALIQDGPFSVCRNPSYIFSFIGLVGVLTGSHYLVLLVIALFYRAYYFFVIRIEEERLSGLFKEEFTRYCSRVHRFLPDPRKYWSRDVVEINSYLVLREIIRSGFFMWALLLLKILEYLKTIEVNGKALIPALWNIPF
jgi:protein-S-isoprenylcysteine O-methyltransferase Ste14